MLQTATKLGCPISFSVVQANFRSSMWSSGFAALVRCHDYIAHHLQNFLEVQRVDLRQNPTNASTFELDFYTMNDPFGNSFFGIRGFLASWVKSVQAGFRLRREFGHGLTASTRYPVDREGKPLPWYTYPAIEYLMQLDLKNKTVFEFGSGNSSLFWAARAKRVISVENDPAWYRQVMKSVPPNLDLRLRESPEDYVRCITEENLRYDLVVVDGIVRSRCARAALSRLADGGLIILDNADWFTSAAAILRQSDLIQIDMKGFGPVNAYAWCTTLFLHRGFKFGSIGQIQPSPGMGSIQQPVDDTE